MKKVFIGCAAVLLSLGLLAGCDEEEGDKAVSIKVDNAATVVVGDTLELPYTVEPEKAKIEVLNEYEEYVTAEAEDGVLYLSGLSEGDATITLVGTYRKYTEANVNISVSVVTKSTEDTEPEPVPTPETPTVSFSLSETSCDLTVGETIEIGYTLDPSDATVIATSGNDDYVTTAVGTDVISLTGIGEGTTTVSVTASYEGYISATETISVSVTQGTVAVTGVTIDQGSQLTLAADATTTLTATVTPANATNPAVTWAVTGETGVITLDTTTGEVTAGSESGSTEVTVTTVDGGFTDSITITVEVDVVPEVESIAFDSNKTYSVEKGQQLDVANDVVATWKDNITGDTPEYVFNMEENSYASLSGSVITGVASTYGAEDASLPVVTASITGNSNVASASQAITVTEVATLTGISFNDLPTSVNAGATIDLSQYISITGTGDNWESLAANATVTYGLGETSTSVASISGSTVTTVSTITADASITVTAKLADYPDVTSATATISVVAPLTIMSAAFKEQSYDLTIGTEMDFTGEIEVTYNKEGSIEYSVELSASPDENLEISGTTVTATGNVESTTLTATIKWGDGESTTCETSISAVATELRNFTLELTLLDSSSNPIECPSYGVFLIEGDFYTDESGNWLGSTDYALTATGTQGVYTYTFETLKIPESGYSFRVLFHYNDEEEVLWEEIHSSNEWFNVSAGMGDNYTANVTINNCDLSKYPEHGSDVECYFCIYDVTGGTLKCSVIYMSSDQVVLEGENKYCNATTASVNVGGTSHAYAYGPNPATYPSGTSGLWMNWNSGCSTTQKYYSEEIIVPSNCGSVATYIAQADLSGFVDYGQTGTQINTTPISAAWYAGDPATAIATMLNLS